jgi:NAD(P)-dependent dehydrogenase (short-subunit alcohol dehydrogenase family)
MSSILVTGGASGLGHAIVDTLLTAGQQPAVLDLKPPRFDVPYQAVDLADTRAAQDAVEALAATTGGLRAVVTAAGIDSPGRLSDVDRDDWERVVLVNLLGTAAVVRAALPELRRTRGHVVTVASTLGLRAVSDATAYCAAKFGVVGFTRALAAELGDEVGVTLLVPGGMRTPFFDGRDEQYRPGADAALNDPAHVADAVLFALSQPAGCAVRELVICPSLESSYP